MVRPSLKVAQGFKRYCDFCFREVQKFVSVTWASLLFFFFDTFFSTLPFLAKSERCAFLDGLFGTILSLIGVLFSAFCFLKIIKLRGVDVCGCNFDTRAALL